MFLKHLLALTLALAALTAAAPIPESSFDATAVYTDSEPVLVRNAESKANPVPIDPKRVLLRNAQPKAGPMAIDPKRVL